MWLGWSFSTSLCLMHYDVKKVSSVCTRCWEYVITRTSAVDSQQILEEALEKGYVNCYIWKVLVTGAAGSGKTCLKHRLLGEEPPSIRCSTALAEAPIRAISHEIVGTDKTGWFRVTYDELMEMLGGALKAGVPMERSRVLPSGMPEQHVDSFSLPYP